MANYSIWALGESEISISGGGQLDGVTQGDGSHLVGLFITLESNSYEEINIRDRPNSDNNFDDNDGDQRTRGRNEFDGVRYNNNTVVEAEYLITLLDEDTGDEYTAIAVNFVNSSPSYATIEGLAFVAQFPPIGTPLKVIEASEGPGDFGVPAIPADDIAAPPCFTPGTLILTPDGQKAVETLSVGDLVSTLDHGDQPIRWIGTTTVSPYRMAMSPGFRPIRIRKNAFGAGQPTRDMLVSPQHRILLEGWVAELLYGELQVLVAAAHLLDDRNVVQAWDKTQITYLHLQFDNHELLYSDGLLTESFNPGPTCLESIPEAAREELVALFPESDLSKDAPNEAVRPMITRREARALGAVA
ncbi:MAG: Hint domain-containing protein [Roseobacter sp.]